VIFLSFKAVGRAIRNSLYDLTQRWGKHYAFLQPTQLNHEEMPVEDPAQDNELPRTWMWMLGLILSVVGMCAVLGSQYHMPLGMSLLSVFLAFFFSFLAIQCTGVTGTCTILANPN
jgi:hypothetical protein